MLALHKELDWQKKRLISAFIETYLELSSQEQRKYELQFQLLGTPVQEQIVNLETKWSRDGFAFGKAEALTIALIFSGMSSLV